MTQLDPPDSLVVTGASGWFGRALLDRLGHAEEAVANTVIAVVEDAEHAGTVSAACPSARSVVADIRDGAAVHAALATAHGVVDVIHAAGVIHPHRVADFDAVNARGTAHVVAATRSLGVRRLVHLSSNSPFGTNATVRDVFGTHEPYHPYLGYGRSKMAAELAVLDAAEAGMDAVIVRPPWFYGPWQPRRQTTFFQLVRRGRFPVLGDGRQRRSMVYVENLVDGVLAAQRTAEVAGRGYWIADERPYTVDEIVRTVREALRANGLECSDRTLRLPRIAGQVAERLDRTLQRSGRYQQQLHVLGEMAHTIAVDISAARADLGYEPSVALAEGMQESVRWCLAQGYDL